MKYNITRIVSMLMLGAALATAPVIGHAQTATDDTATAPVPTQSEIRAAGTTERTDTRNTETAAQRAARIAAQSTEFEGQNEIRSTETAAQAAQRAAETAARQQRSAEDYADQRDDALNGRLKNDVFMILNRSLNQIADEDAKATMRADEALKYGGFCYTDSNGQRQCTQGTEDQKNLDADAAARKTQRDYEAQLYGDPCAKDATSGIRTKTDGPCSIGALKQEAMEASEVRQTIREKEQADAKAIYDKRIADNKATAAQITGGTVGAASTIGSAITNFGSNLVRFPQLFYLLSYICGVYFMAMGLVKANRTAMEPGRNPVSDAVKYVCAGVFLAALPMTLDVLNKSFGFQSSTMALDYSEGLKGAAGSNTASQGLDQFIILLVKDITSPLLTITALICFAGGVFLLFQGLQRLTKGAQEGPKGPAGLGTLMTFVVGSALISFVPTLELLMNSVFGSTDVMTFPEMSAIATGLGTTEANLAQAQAVITALLAFLGIIGVISFARGLFMMKDVADGAQNASLMGSMSHMIAGVCCVNFGAFANLLQTTLHLQGFGITFK